MPMRLIRRPRVNRRIKPEVLKEVKAAYQHLGKKTDEYLAKEISDWNHKPKFGYWTKVDTKEWKLTIFHDKNSEAGKIYNWVSKGTGARGDDPRGKAYPITPKRAKALSFSLPMEIKTLADFGKFAPSFHAAPQVVVTQAVMAPGIYPRHLGKSIFEHLKTRKSGSFHNVTEAAIKRAFRRMLIYVG